MELALQCIKYIHRFAMFDFDNCYTECLTSDAFVINISVLNLIVLNIIMLKQSAYCH